MAQGHTEGGSGKPELKLSVATKAQAKVSQSNFPNYRLRHSIRAVSKTL